MKQTIIPSKLAILILVFILFAGCHRYYMVLNQNIKDDPGKSIDSLKNDNRYFVLHSGIKAWHLRGVVLSDDRKAISGTLETLPAIHQTTIGNTKQRYKEPDVLNEVHFYIDKDSLLHNGDITLGLDRIQKVEVIEKDKKERQTVML